MSHLSRSPAYEQQRRAEDLSALTSERVAADAREAALLARLGLTLVTPTGASLRLARQIAGELLAMDAAENAGHSEALAISRQLAGQCEAWNAAQFAANKKTPSLLVTDPEQAKGKHLKDTTAGSQLGLFGAPE